MHTVDVAGDDFDNFFGLFLNGDCFAEDPELSGAAIIPESSNLDDFFNTFDAKNIADDIQCHFEPSSDH